MKRIFLVGIAALFLIVFTYGCYWVAKTVSYKLFYKDMVEQTVREMVKPESLK